MRTVYSNGADLRAIFLATTRIGPDNERASEPMESQPISDPNPESVPNIKSVPDTEEKSVPLVKAEPNETRDIKDEKPETSAMNTGEPVSKRRKRDDKTDKANRDMEELRHIAVKMRRLPVEQLVTIEEYVGLSELTKYAVIEALEVNERTTMHGKAAFIKCIMERGDKGRTLCQLMAPERFLQIQTPAVLVYMGKTAIPGRVTGKAVNESHKLYAVDHTPLEMSELRNRATGIRALKPDDLESMFGVKVLKDFKIGTVFVLKDLRHIVSTATDEEIPIVQFETEGDDGKTQSGEVYLPKRYVPYLEQPNGVGVLAVYKGEKQTTNGRTCYDLSFHDAKSAHVVYAV